MIRRDFKIVFCLLIIGSLFIPLNFVLGADGDIVINEIAWMGTEVSSSDEWIELYNNTDQEIDLTGWTLKSADERPEISLNGIIPAQGFFLLERTDDNSVLEITADQIYSGALSNSGEKLGLYDTEDNLIDSVDCSEGWFSGDNSSKQTMERKNPQSPGNSPDNWQSSQSPGGTPKSQNSSGQEILPEPESEEPPEEPSPEELYDEGWSEPIEFNHPPTAEAGSNITGLIDQEIFFDASQSRDEDGDNLTYLWNFGDGTTDTQTQTSHKYSFPGQYIVSLSADDGKLSNLDITTINIYSSSIIISEFMPDYGWIELFNQSKQMANLSGWQLDSPEDNSPFIFPENTLIGPNQFLVLSQDVTKLSLNNQIQLFYPDQSLAAQVSYENTDENGASIAFNGQSYSWTKIPTPGTTNIISGRSMESKNVNPVINQQSQNLPNDQTKINLAQNQEFVLNNTEELNNKPNPPIAALNQSSPKDNLILVLSIIISASLLFGWVLIQVRKKISH